MDELLTCPVCLDVASPTYQCVNGHLVCGPCHTRLDLQPKSKQVCPTCRVPYGDGPKIRCLVAEALIDVRGLKSGGNHHRNRKVSAVYQTIAENTSVDRECSPKSESVGMLPCGSFVQVVEIKTVKAEKLIRGRMECGGWISLEEMVSGRTWVRQLDTGTYVITGSSVTITAGVSLDSEKVGRLSVDDYVDVVAIRHLPEGERVRAKLAAGGWITCIDTLNGKELARPVRKGVYATVLKSTDVNVGVRRESAKSRKLDSGACVQVLDTMWTIQDECVRGQLKGGGWVSVADKMDWRIYLQPLPVGAYQTSDDEELSAHRGLKPDSEEVEHIPAGSYVEIVETTYLEEEQMVRGRLVSGPWINLVDASTGYTHAGPVPVGVYVITADSVTVNNGASCKSKTMRKIPKFTSVEVVELRYLPIEKRVRARLASYGGGWFTMIDSKGGRAKPIMVGTYTTTKEYITAQKGFRLDTKEVMRIPGGKNVEIVETRFDEQDGCIRGRLAQGGWISLVNTKDNTKYAKKFRRRTLFLGAACTSP